jgi:hypothetical protein
MAQFSVHAVLACSIVRFLTRPLFDEVLEDGVLSKFSAASFPVGKLPQSQTFQALRVHLRIVRDPAVNIP